MTDRPLFPDHDLAQGVAPVPLEPPLPPPLTNTLVLPLRFWRPTLRVVGDAWCPDDQAYLVDNDGRVHAFKRLGRLVDMPPPPPEELEDDE